MKECAVCGQCTTDSASACECGGALRQSRPIPKEKSSLLTPGYIVLALLIGILVWQTAANYLDSADHTPQRTTVARDAPPAPLPPTASPESFAHHEVATFTDLGRTWHVVALPKPLSDADLTRFAVSLHSAHPNDAFELFDSDPGIKAYIKWSERHPPVAPYPERWMRLHHLAMINRMLDGWQRFHCELWFRAFSPELDVAGRPVNRAYGQDHKT